jgi:hypothetical protein
VAGVARRCQVLPPLPAHRPSHMLLLLVLLVLLVLQLQLLL